MNLISGLMALSHHFSKLNYHGAKWDLRSSESHPLILQVVLGRNWWEGDLHWKSNGLQGAASKNTLSVVAAL